MEQFAQQANFSGKVVTDRARLKRLMTRHDPHIYPGSFVTCIYVPERALCSREDDKHDGPSLGDCQPLRCRNVALDAGNRTTLTGHLHELDQALGDGEALAPYPRRRMEQQSEEITTFLHRHSSNQDPA
ncbi:hypothetical protein ACOZ38_29480 [Sphaerisporangium viridialbum]|uniref:hypothetical protein n=1 Tax=Sphaerisporangium viridialbum TaxID=46189 RepID=UPI003C709558